MWLFKKSKKIKKDKNFILETYNTKRAHEEMIWKSGGVCGIHYGVRLMI